jgi:hypothetical protein
MNSGIQSIANWFREVARGWDRFWFTPALPHTLALVRICGGAMLLYTHAVWSLNLNAFLGRDAWVDARTAWLLNQDNQGHNYAWSYLYYIDSPALLWTAHIAALIVFALLMLGLFTRVTSVLAWVITIAYCNRLTGTLFGLDQINAFIATYLIVGDSGGAWSLDRWLAQRGKPLAQRNAREGVPYSAAPTIRTNIAIRLLQVHMCVIYLFGGIAKMRGETWWDGSALWYAFAQLEYQSIDMTWTAQHRWLLGLFTHVTVFWETFYCFLVWPKLTRPLCLAMAVGVHLGIAIFLGMKTFGLAMIIGNLAFVYPETVRDSVAWLSGLSRVLLRKTHPQVASRGSLAVAATR